MLLRSPARFGPRFSGLIALSTLSIGIHPAYADRIVLAPAGTTLPETSFLSEIAVNTSIRKADYEWFAYSSGDGIEMEINRYESSTLRNKQWSMNFEYPLPTIRDLPAISLGIRDLTGTGAEHGALFLAATRGIKLSAINRRAFRSINVSAGAGTGTIGGAFVGVESRLTAGLNLTAEIYRHRPNFGVGLPLVRDLQLKAYSLNGTIYYGASFHKSL
jgi:hypothetical protein